MLKIDQAALEQMVQWYQGITESIMRLENDELLSCPNCGWELKDLTGLTHA